MKRTATAIAVIAFVTALYLAVIVAFYCNAKPMPEYELPKIYIKEE